MTRRFLARMAFLAVPLLATNVALGVGILGPGDDIIAIDLDPPFSNSNYPAGEPPSAAVDGTLAKYLNFGGAGSGIIVTPTIPADSVAEGLRLTTAGDAEGRDPTSYQIWGTNDPIMSADNSAGTDENWTLITADDVDLPLDRNTPGDLLSFANVSTYSSYKLVFPTNRGDALFQIAEIELFGDIPDLNVFDQDLFNAGDATLAIHFGPDSRYPGDEGPSNLLDGDAGTKYLNFGQANSGFIVTPETGSTIVENFRITTANDFPERDPASWEVYGTNEPIASMDNSQGMDESWTLIDAGSIELPADRLVNGPIVPLDNDSAYMSYRVVFPTLVDASASNSMQISNFQFNVPEPSSALLAVWGLSAAMLLRRRNR